MKNRIFCSIVALAMVFSACSKDDFEDQVESNEDLTVANQEDDNAVSRTNLGDEYIVNPDGLAAAIVNDRYVYITRFILTDVHGNERYAYCADMESPCYPGSTYISVSANGYFKDDAEIKIKAAFNYVMNHYGWMEASNPHGYRLIVQCIMWRIIHGYEVTLVGNAEAELIKEVIDYVYDNIDEITENHNAGIAIEGVDDATVDGRFVNYGPYMISENALLTDVYFNLSNDAEGVIFISDTGTEITQVKPEEPFYLRVSHDFSGDISFTATASKTNELYYVNDFLFFIDVRDVDFPVSYQFQPLFQPIVSHEAWTDFYSYTYKFEITPTEIEPEPKPKPDKPKPDPKPKPDKPKPDPKPETITLTGLSWNNGNGNGNGAGINQFTVNGITLKNNKNHVTPANFEILIKRTPGRNDVTAIYTVTERTVSLSNGKYQKVYDIKVALYGNGSWKGYRGTITVDNPGGNNKNQQVVLERYF